MKKKREYINAQRDERRKRQKEDDVRKDIECQQRSRRYYQMIRSCAPKRAIGRIQVDEEVIYQPREIAQAFLRHFIQTAMPIEDPNFNEPWKKMVEDIVNTTCSEYERSLQDLKQVKIVTESEVSNIIQRLKKRKAPGTDEITAEHLYEAERELSRPIANCIREIMKTAKIPENFKCGLITPVFKGHGNKPEAPDSYRDISVLTVLCKVFEKVLIQRLDEGLRKAGIPSELQFAYQKERNTLQANLILREVISANRDVGKTVYVAYLDVRKCFNSVWHAGLIYKLIEAKIQPRLVLVLYNLYQEFRVRVKVREVSETGYMKQGLKQGGVLSTSLLTLYMHDKIQMIQEAQTGAQIGDIRIPIIAYADDEVLVATEPKELQQMLDIAYCHSTKWRYKYNVQKSKIMIYGRDTGISWRLGNERIEVTSEYLHLGIIMTTGPEGRRRVDEGMKKARRAMYAKCSSGMNIHRVSPLSLYTTWRIYAEPILLYFLPVTCIAQTDLKLLENMMLRILRAMQGLPSRTQKAVVYTMIGALPCRLLIAQSVLQFILFMKRAAECHPVSEYVLLHGALNDDRSSSILRQWEKYLNELNLPSIIQLMENKGQHGKTWKSIFEQAINNQARKMLSEEAINLKSVNWLADLIAKQTCYGPAGAFWPTCRHSVVGRQATGTRIRLLTEQSLLATGIVRRHIELNEVCPLCRRLPETLEHFLFECSELKQDREDAQNKYRAELIRNQPAKQLICEAERKQSMMIHYVYKARIRKEILIEIYQHDEHALTPGPRRSSDT